MPEIINYGNIAWTIYNHYSEKLTDWEAGFIEDITNQTYEFTDKQKEVILKLNRKYVVRR